VERIIDLVFYLPDEFSAGFWGKETHPPKLPSLGSNAPKNFHCTCGCAPLRLDLGAAAGAR